MVSEQIQNYVNLVGGLTKATKAKATEAAQGLLSATHLDGVATGASGKVAALTEEILAASRANRELLSKTISTEVDKAAAKLGFARNEDLDALRAEVDELRAAVAEQAARAEAAQGASRKAAAKKTTAKKTAAKKSADTAPPATDSTEAAAE
ncbi:MAG: polyhydroxyalkanoate synthesis protein PhaF [Microlunatus sp.]